jgi:uncharacterized protein involved in exopolysaccharide biosynthesis
MSLPAPGRPAGPPPESHSGAIDLHDLLFRMRRYGWLLLLPVVACLCVAAVYARHTAPVYQSYLVLSVDEPADVSPGLRSYVQGGAVGIGPRERITFVDGRIHNHTFLKAVAERMGMNRDPVLLARAQSATRATPGITAEEYALRLAVGQLWGKIGVSQGRGTAVQVTVRDTSPTVARDLASVIGDGLLEQSLAATLEKAQARGEFSKEQVAVHEERLRKAENELRAFQESHLRRSITAGIASEADLLAAQSLNRSTEDEIAALRARIAAGNEEWARASGNATMPTLSSPAAADLTTRLVRLEEGVALAQLGGKGTAGELESTRGRITATRQALFVELDRVSQEMEGGYSPEAKYAASGVALDRAVLRSLQARAAKIVAAIRDYVAVIQTSPRDQIELQKLQDNVQAARNILTTFQNEAMSSGLSEALATSQVGLRLSILEPPLLPLTPSSLGPQATFAVAIFLGILIDVAIVFAGERLATVVRTVEQAEAEYGLRVVGVVPRVLNRPKPGGYLKNHWPKFAIVAVIVLTALVVVVEMTLFAPPAKTVQTTP